MARSQVAQNFDLLLKTRDGNATTASGADQVGGVDKILDLGQGRVDGILVVDASAIDVATGDEVYHIEVQVSDVADFSTGSPKIKTVAILRLGDSSVAFNDADTTVPSHYTVPFTNEHAGVVYRYLRTYHRQAGAVANSITYNAWIGVNKAA